jgi:hypothetical protein
MVKINIFKQINICSILAYQLPAAVYVPPAAAQLQMEQPYGGLPGQGYEQFIQEARNGNKLND